jgi:ACDE family multidrug resistance protein
MQRWIQRHSVRAAVRLGFLGGALCFLAGGGPFAHWPWVSIAVLLAGTLALVLLDVSGGLPFLMAVKPSERVEMSAIYSSFRDVSGILTPGIAWAILRRSDIPAIFAITGVAMIVTWMVAGLLHPRLGTRRGVRAA